jgi:hypothetical protein
MTRSQVNATTQQSNGGTTPPFLAGKNKIINGDFGINQRNFTSATTNGYMFDRFAAYTSDGTVTYSAQTFTLGTAPVAGYESKNFLRCITTGQTATSAAANFSQAIESVRTFAGQTVTISFWAKAASGTPKAAVEFQQQFGTGGSPSSSVGVYAGQVTLSTSWTRYSLTVAVPSIAGKTIGTTTDGACQLVVWYSGGSDFNSRIGSLGIQSNTFDIWGVQVEAGSVATPFTTASNTLQGELALCQRYYYRLTPAGGGYGRFGVGLSNSTTTTNIFVNFPVNMRVIPIQVETTGTASNYNVLNASGGIVTLSATPTFDTATYNSATLGCTVSSGLVAGNATQLLGNNSPTAYLAWSAEL